MPRQSCKKKIEATVATAAFFIIVEIRMLRMYENIALTIGLIRIQRPLLMIKN